MDNGRKTVGILAVQGDFEMHAKMLDRIGARWKLVRNAHDLEGVAALIMPGGESTTMLKFFSEEGLGPAIKKFADEGKPVFGTCAGAILLAREVSNPPQEKLALLEIASHPLEMVFIRAPIIRRVGAGVKVLGHSGELPVLVEQENILAATFHPELTEDE